MQSSGASLFALLLGQIPESVVVVDLWAPCVAPPLRFDVDVVVKATIVAVEYLWLDNVRGDLGELLGQNAAAPEVGSPGT